MLSLHTELPSNSAPDIVMGDNVGSIKGVSLPPQSLEHW